MNLCNQQLAESFIIKLTERLAENIHQFHVQRLLHKYFLRTELQACKM